MINDVWTDWHLETWLLVSTDWLHQVMMCLSAFTIFWEIFLLLGAFRYLYCCILILFELCFKVILYFPTQIVKNLLDILSRFCTYFQKVNHIGWSWILFCQLHTLLIRDLSFSLFNITFVTNNDFFNVLISFFLHLSDPLLKI